MLAHEGTESKVLSDLIEDMDKSIEAGMVAHLSKPFTKQMLEEILHKYLKK